MLCCPSTVCGELRKYNAVNFKIAYIVIDRYKWVSTFFCPTVLLTKMDSVTVVVRNHLSIQTIICKDGIQIIQHKMSTVLISNSA